MSLRRHCVTVYDIVRKKLHSCYGTNQIIGDSYYTFLQRVDEYEELLTYYLTNLKVFSFIVCKR